MTDLFNDLRNKLIINSQANFDTIMKELFV